MSCGAVTVAEFFSVMQREMLSREGRGPFNATHIKELPQTRGGPSTFNLMILVL